LSNLEQPLYHYYIIAKWYKSSISTLNLFWVGIIRIKITITITHVLMTHKYVLQKHNLQVDVSSCHRSYFHEPKMQFKLLMRSPPRPFPEQLKSILHEVRSFFAQFWYISSQYIINKYAKYKNINFFVCKSLTIT